MSNIRVKGTLIPDGKGGFHIVQAKRNVRGGFGKVLILILALFVAVIMALSKAGAAEPSPWNGDKIISDCRLEKLKTADQTMRAFMCYGYVRGVGDGYFNVGACLPREVTTQQLIDVAVKFLRNNPQHRHLYAADIFMAAWGEAWSCKQEEKPQFKPSFKPL
jgi:hypothetical protein